MNISTSCMYIKVPKRTPKIPKIADPIMKDLFTFILLP